MAKRRNRKPTVTQQIMNVCMERINKKEHNLTRQNYQRTCYNFVRWCRENHNVKTYDEAKELLQKYADDLQQKGYSPSTIHSYLAGPCCGFNVKMDSIEKPRRVSADYTRSRFESSCPPPSRDPYTEKVRRITELQIRTGIRKSELYRLRNKNFMQDESGYWCVEVENGKGGKYQLNRLLECDVEFIRGYFGPSKPDEYIFTQEEIQASAAVDLHRLRAQCAKNYYYHLLARIKADPSYAEQLEAEIRKRWKLYNIDKKTGKPKHLKNSLIQGDYVLRGELRKKAIREGKDYRFSKICLLATSMFKLSHYRNNIVVASYLYT